MTDQSRPGRHPAGALDIRAIIAYLLGLYGVVLVGMGLFAYGAAEQDKTGGWNVNLWGGLGMIAVAVAFLVWNRLQPVEVPDAQAERSRRSSDDA